MSKTFHVIGRDSSVSSTFSRRLGMKETDFEDAEVVIFTGGEDVSPSWYKEERLVGTYCNDKRDDMEVQAFWEARSDKMIIGICRGAQLIHVMEDGKLWQDVSGHSIGGAEHPAFDMVTGQAVHVTSCHHQMMRVDNAADPMNEFQIVCIAAESNKRKAAGIVSATSGPGKFFRNDIEVLWYPKINALCYQGHPEWHGPNCLKYFTKLMKRYHFIASDTSSGSPAADDDMRTADAIMASNGGMQCVG